MIFRKLQVNQLNFTLTINKTKNRQVSNKQINFYALEEEIVKFLEAFDIEIIGMPIFNNEVVSFVSLSEAVKYNFNWPLQYRITKQEFSSDICLKFIESQNYYLIDSLRSPVIDLTLCYCDLKQNKIRRGRMFYQTGFYNNDEVWQDKNHEFVSWADELLKAFAMTIKVRKDKYNDIISACVDELINSQSLELLSS